MADKNQNIETETEDSPGSTEEATAEATKIIIVSSHVNASLVNVHAGRFSYWSRHKKWIIASGIIFLLLIIIIVVVRISTSRTDWDPSFEDYQNEALQLHNTYRKKHSAGPLRLNRTLSELAVKCAMFYVNRTGGADGTCPYVRLSGAVVGENAYQDSKKKALIIDEVKIAVDGWYKENEDYDYGKPGLIPVTTNQFSAMVWKAVTELGVGSYQFENFTMVIALYYPKPLAEGQFEANVLRPSSIFSWDWW